jgi:hypothetical protein
MALCGCAPLACGYPIGDYLQIMSSADTVTVRKGGGIRLFLNFHPDTADKKGNLYAGKARVRMRSSWRDYDVPFSRCSGGRLRSGKTAWRFVTDRSRRRQEQSLCAGSLFFYPASYIVKEALAGIKVEEMPADRPPGKGGGPSPALRFWHLHPKTATNCWTWISSVVSF